MARVEAANRGVGRVAEIRGSRRLQPERWLRRRLTRQRPTPRRRHRLTRARTSSGLSHPPLCRLWISWSSRLGGPRLGRRQGSLDLLDAGLCALIHGWLQQPPLLANRLLRVHPERRSRRRAPCRSSAIYFCTDSIDSPTRGPLLECEGVARRLDGLAGLAPWRSSWYVLQAVVQSVTHDPVRLGCEPASAAAYLI